MRKVGKSKLIQTGYEILEVRKLTGSIFLHGQPQRPPVWTYQISSIAIKYSIYKTTKKEKFLDSICKDFSNDIHNRIYHTWNWVSTPDFDL